MNPAQQLQQLFEQHKPAVLGVAAAGVAGAALLHRRKAGEAATPRTSSGTLANPNPAAAVVPGNGGGYDSSAYDVYNALQSQLGPLLDQARQSTGGAPGGGINTAPAPVASPLFKPGFYRSPADGAIYQVDAAGKRDWLTPAEWKSLGAAGKYSTTPVATDSAFFTSTTAVGTQPGKK